jgi:hypothetical protein
MLGKLNKTKQGWSVTYLDSSNILNELPVYHRDVELIDAISFSQDSTEIEFEIIDEFSSPKLFEDVDFMVGVECAKLKL